MHSRKLTLLTVLLFAVINQSVRTAVLQLPLGGLGTKVIMSPATRADFSRAIFYGEECALGKEVLHRGGGEQANY